jgi:NAD(P)-dependent dehydrogenase (short-subunit alcohol dehydrogenase family)
MDMQGEAIAHVCDVSDRGGVDDMLEDAERTFGSLDIVVPNAYHSYRAPFLELEWPV